MAYRAGNGRQTKGYRTETTCGEVLHGPYRQHNQPRQPFSAGRIFLPYKSIYNVSSTASREFLRKPRDGPNVFGNACNGVANTRKFFVRLATVLQTPESFSWHLQHSCKHQKVFRGTCSIPANSKKFFEAFAAFLQTPKSFSRHLQRPCKRQKVF